MLANSPVPEPVTPDPPRPLARPLMTQSWLDLAFVHWAVAPERVAGLLPAGTAPDMLDGTTYVGLIAFRVQHAGLFSLPGVPYLGDFPETNVRLYSVDESGRRGVVFRSLDAARLVPVVTAQAGFRLPYKWSRMAVRARGDTITYTSSRRWPEPRGAHSRIAIRKGERVTEPTELEHFLTARWGLHNDVLGQLVYLPNAHQRWPLHRADLLVCDEDLVAAAGLPGQLGDPVSVLYSPGVEARMGRPSRVLSS